MREYLLEYGFVLFRNRLLLDLNEILLGRYDKVPLVEALALEEFRLNWSLVEIAAHRGLLMVQSS